MKDGVCLFSLVFPDESYVPSEFIFLDQAPLPFKSTLFFFWLLFHFFFCALRNPTASCWLSPSIVEIVLFFSPDPLLFPRIFLPSVCSFFFFSLGSLGPGRRSMAVVLTFSLFPAKAYEGCLLFSLVRPIFSLPRIRLLLVFEGRKSPPLD